jgi:Ca-activated chloride channel family protein
VKTRRAGGMAIAAVGRRCIVPAAAVLAVALGVVIVRAQFASGITLVEVYATVGDARGGPILDLQKGDFRVFEDGVPQTITTFASGDFPLAVALAIDRSWSMAGERLALAKAAARTFLQQLRPGDRSMLIAVASDTQVAAPLSADHAAALQALARLEPWSTTGLYDAIITCIGMVQPASGRRALILLSDGVDRYSRATASDALERARRADVLLYPIAIGRTRPQLFPELAALTGGQSFLLRDPKQIDTTLSTIAGELRHQYLLGYSPSRPIDPARPEWRAIEVKMDRPGVKVRARDGYLAR